MVQMKLCLKDAGP